MYDLSQTKNAGDIQGLYKKQCKHMAKLETMEKSPGSLGYISACARRSIIFDFLALG